MIARTTAGMLLVLLLPISTLVSGQSWKMQPVSIATRWASQVEPTNVWPEYPRPQMVRPEWQNLNGLWEYAITPATAPAPERYEGHILVPYPVESALSGVKRPLQPDQLLWYRRTLDMSPATGERILLHFGAVDFKATVFLNGSQLGTHSGGFQSFTFEITNALKSGSNELVVKVHDPTEQGPNSYGKQSLHAQWMYYTPSSGIWQTVWLERVPSTYIQALKLTPDVNRGELRVQVTLDGPLEGYAVEATARDGGKIVGRATIDASAALRIDRPRLWSPDDPHLYDLEVRVIKDGQVIDEVKSYFGLRKIELKNDAEGRARIHLNDRYTYNLGVVDQGFWPDGLYTAATDDALMFDVQAAKAMGFNTIRKHMKLEPQRWYYHCDRLGVLVWQDMPAANNDTPEGRAQFEQEITANLGQLHNHPSITTWVLFNEGWGAYDQARLAHWIKQADSSRLVNGHSGPYDHVKYAQWLKRLEPKRLVFSLGGEMSLFEEFQNLQFGAPAEWMVGDMADLHYYPGPRMFPAREANMTSVTGEHGSFGVYIEGHIWDELRPVGKGTGATGMAPKKFLEAYAKSIERLKVLESQGLSGSLYFETADVETEQQGFLTYDRAVAKVSAAEILRLNEKLVTKADNYAVATKGFTVATVDATPESQRYQNLVAEFRRGRREPMFLRRLALMALRQNDQGQATAAGNQFVAGAQAPYSKQTWEVIIAITRLPDDRGFELLRVKAAEVNAILGAQTAEKKILEILQREVITPYFKSRSRSQSWPDFENSVAARYGDLGREAVRGAQMMEVLISGDWAAFGEAYVRYYETAVPRSLYLLHNLSHKVLTHVTDSKALQSAIRAMKWQLDAPREDPVFGQYDPTELDTYANLLYKVGRTSEALDWQKRAVAASHRRDPEILQNLEKMTSGLTTSARANSGAIIYER